MTPREYRVIVAGTPGAGKTTAIRQLCPPAIAAPTSPPPRSRSQPGDLITISFAYTEIPLDGGDLLRFYETPAHEALPFIWPLALRGAIGIIYVLDARRPALADDLDRLLRAFGERARALPGIIALTRLPCAETDPIAPLRAYLDTHTLDWPRIAVDLRERHHAELLMEMLLSVIEADATIRQ